jgi:hypothetical protein
MPGLAHIEGFFIEFCSFLESLVNLMRDTVYYFIEAFGVAAVALAYM